MKNSLLEMMFKHESDANLNSEIIRLYHESRNKWTEENGTCLNAENYVEHWNKREDYIKMMMCQYFKQQGYCQNCDIIQYEKAMEDINQTIFKKYYDQCEIEEK